MKKKIFEYEKKNEKKKIVRWKRKMRDRLIVKVREEHICEVCAWEISYTQSNIHDCMV